MLTPLVEVTQSGVNHMAEYNKATAKGPVKQDYHKYIQLAQV